MTSPPSLSVAVRAVLRRTVDTFRGDPETERWLRSHLDRLDEPLRVAIAGKVKAGKSTLLNALIGEEIAPTDAGECTRVVTWYRDGPTPKITLHPVRGLPAALPVHRAEGALEIDLQGTPPEQVDRLTVDWPSQSLRTSTLIDTPGIAAPTGQASGRALAFLTPEDAPTEADAVIYLMRHLHSADTQFLESFRDQGVARASPVNTIAVLSRADEIGAGRIDALESAAAVARRYRTDSSLRGLCQDVVAVAGLLAQTGRTLRRAEYAALAALAELPREELAALLLSADRFLAADPGKAPSLGDQEVPPELRQALLDRFGLFGIRLSVTLIRQGTDGPAALAAELVNRSGLVELREVLAAQFTARRDLLKARSGLLAVETALRQADTRADTRALEAEVERILSGAHEFAELRLLAQLRSGAVTLPDEQGVEAERLLGGSGPGPAARLGLDPLTEAGELVRAAQEARSRWQRRAENPLSSRDVAEACRVLVRSCEGILAAAENPGAHPGGGGEPTCERS